MGGAFPRTCLIDFNKQNQCCRGTEPGPIIDVLKLDILWIFFQDVLCQLWNGEHVEQSRPVQGRWLRHSFGLKKGQESNRETTKERTFLDSMEKHGTALCFSSAKRSCFSSTKQSRLVFHWHHFRLRILFLFRGDHIWLRRWGRSWLCWLGTGPVIVGSQGRA